MSALVDAHPRIREVDDRIAEVQAEEDLYRQGVMLANREYEAAKEAHHAEAQKALARGKAPASAIPQPTVTAEEQQSRTITFERRKEALNEERMRVLAEIGPEVEAEAAKIRDRVVASARQQVRALDVLAVELRAAQDAVVAVASARSHLDRQDPLKGGVQIQAPDPASAESLVQAVRYRTDPLEVRIPRRLGFQEETAWEPPLPAR